MDKTDKKTENYELGCGMRQAAAIFTDLNLGRGQV
jgi:hypothetical protein